MKRLSLYFSAPYTLTLQQETLPALTTGQVVVQTIISAISPGTELLLYRGQMPADMATDETIAALAGRLRYPLKYGYAAVGRVIATGAEVDRRWQDRLVFAFHPHESHFLATPADLMPLPDGLSPETAAFLPNMETAVSFLMDGRPVIGEQVAVFGQGVVGLLATMLLAQLPLASLVTVDHYSLRRRWSRQLGAQASLDPADAGVLAQLQQQLQSDSAYAGADLTYELSGNPEALDLAIAATGYNGRIVVGSWYGQKRANLDLGGRFHRDHMRLISTQVSHLAPQWRGRWNKARRLQTAWTMLAQHRPEALITHRLPFSEALEAYRLLDESPAQTVQVVLTYDQ